MSGKVWSLGELEYLSQWYLAHQGKALDLANLARNLGRSAVAVSIMARHLGLTEQRRQRPSKRRAKYATVAERRAAIGRATRERIARVGHPRGARGMKRTAEHTDKLLGAAKRWHEETPQAVKRAVTAKMVATRIARHGTAGPPLHGTRAFSRAKSGRREDLGIYVRSMWEANYARYLNFLHDRGLISGWAYEAKTFRFDGISRGCMTYTPDFEVRRPGGVVEYHEVKGWMDQKSRTRLRRMRKYHPSVTLVLVDKHVYGDIERKLSALIPNWERRAR